MVINTPLFSEIDFLITSKISRIIGLNYPIVKGEGGYFSKESNTSLIKNNIRQLILTEKGERPMQPSFGVRLRTKLFEPLDNVTLGELQNDVEKAILQYEPRIIIKSLNVLEDKTATAKDLNRIIIKLVYSLKDAPIVTETLEIIV